MGYKESPVPEARARFTPMVRGLFDAFLAAHRRLPDGRRRGGPRPGRSLDGAPVGGAPLGRGAGARRRRVQAGSARAGATTCSSAVRDGRAHAPGTRRVRRAARPAVSGAGRHLLVLDDTYVSGARAQSAAAALRLAGAASVRIVAAGRVLRPDRVPGHAEFLRRHAAAPTRDVAPPVCARLRSDRGAERVGARRSAPRSAARARPRPHRSRPGATAGSDGAGRRGRRGARDRRTRRSAPPARWRRRGPGSAPAAVVCPRVELDGASERAAHPAVAQRGRRCWPGCSASSRGARPRPWWPGRPPPGAGSALAVKRRLASFVVP